MLLDIQMQFSSDTLLLFLGFSMSSIVSGSLVWRVSGRRMLTKPHPTATAQKMTEGRRCHTSSNSIMSGEMDTPSRAINEVKPMPFCLKESEREGKRENAKQ